jgi:hypothetical protein
MAPRFTDWRRRRMTTSATELDIRRDDDGVVG